MATEGPCLKHCYGNSSTAIIIAAAAIIIAAVILARSVVYAARLCRTDGSADRPPAKTGKQLPTDHVSVS